MSEHKSFVMAISDETQNLHNDAYYLQCLAKNFANVGNTKIAKDLYSLARGLIDSAEKISDAVGREVKEMCDLSAQHSANMLKGVLAGVCIAKPEEADKWMLDVIESQDDNTEV